MKQENDWAANKVKWDQRMLRLAREVSTWSKDPSTQVGAVLVNEERHVKAVGYNGFPRNVKDDERLLDRKTKYAIIKHAEENAFAFCSEDTEGFTLYTYPFMPCARCTGLIIQKKVNHVVTLANDIERWQEDFALSRQIMKEACIYLTEYGVTDEEIGQKS